MEQLIPQIVIDDIKAAMRDGAKLERDRNVIELDAFASMRDVDLLVEDIESGLFSLVDITIPGSNQELFVLGKSGFEATADWQLG